MPIMTDEKEKSGSFRNGKDFKKKEGENHRTKIEEKTKKSD